MIAVRLDLVSQYETGKIESPIFVLLRYAEVANVWLEMLVRDNLDLPVNRTHSFFIL
jgi:hypothetical protein